MKSQQRKVLPVVNLVELQLPAQLTLLKFGDKSSNQLIENESASEIRIFIKDQL
jgi:hypothetical protein